MLSADHIQKTHKEDTDYTSNELTSESEGENDGQINKQKYKNHMQERSYYSAKDDEEPEKPAMQTLKKTFTSMLSKLPFAANYAETSSVSSHREAASTLDRSTSQKRLMKKGSGNLGRAKSASSVNLQHKGINSFEYEVIHY